ncbi:MAG: leucine-rich repeat domain-containing protein [Clostridia bacterium]|nr:leucine-rich repeat domain-containing protein [Clostridia bacterium]
MKNKKLLTLLGILLLLCFATLTACDKTSTSTPHDTTTSHEHIYTDIVIAPTRTEQGYTVHTCSDCGESYTDNYVRALVSEGLSYTLLRDGTCIITGLGTCTDKEIYIPEQIEGCKVVKIADNAFADTYKKITFIDLPNTLTTIGEKAFYKCTGIKEITIPSSVVSIRANSFECCYNLTTIYYNSEFSHNGQPFNKIQSLEKIVFGGNTVPKDAARNVTNLKTVVILDNVTSIGAEAFYNCTNLTSVTIGNGVTKISYQAFLSCTNLKSVTLGTGLKSIADSAFWNCYSITNIVIPNGVTEIGDYAFAGCNALTNLSLPSSITTIRNGAFFGCIGLTSITIPNSVTLIGELAFMGCHNLTSVSLPDSIEIVGDSAFSECDSLTSFTIPKNMTKIDDYMFDDCRKLTDVIIHDGITVIQADAFTDCESLKNIYYTGTADGWGTISFQKSYYDKCFESATIYYYSETQPTDEGNYWHYDINGIPTIWTQE